MRCRLAKAASPDIDNKDCVLQCRWFSSILIHTSFQHVLSNMLLFLVLSWQIEEKYGAVRVAFIFFWSALGGGVLLPYCLLVCPLWVHITTNVRHGVYWVLRYMSTVLPRAEWIQDMRVDSPRNRQHAFDSPSNQAWVMSMSNVGVVWHEARSR